MYLEREPNDIIKVFHSGEWTETNCIWAKRHVIKAIETKFGQKVSKVFVFNNLLALLSIKEQK